MPPPATFQTKVKVQLKLAITRLRMVQSRDEKLSRSDRRAMAQLLGAGKEQSARIRVETIIRTDIITELHELLELNCELLHARAGLLDAATCDPGLDEAVRSIIYAAPRVEDMKELQQLARLLGDKFGRDFYLAAKDNTDGRVPPRVVKKLGVEPPGEELVTGYLEEIARTYGARWPRTKAPQPPENLIDAADGDVSVGGAPAGAHGDAQATPAKPRSAIDDLLLPDETGAEATEQEEEDDREAREREELSKATAPTSFEPPAPVLITPPKPSTDNIHPKVTFNSVEVKSSQKPADAGGARKASDGNAPDFTELAKRFAALKR